MDEAAALLSAVCDKPDDDTVRLAYADFLDEAGGGADAARAEFIRAQVFTHTHAGHAECTGAAAGWCPVCGDCACKDREESMSDPACPLHAPASPHSAWHGRAERAAQLFGSHALEWFADLVPYASHMTARPSAGAETVHSVVLTRWPPARPVYAEVRRGFVDKVVIGRTRVDATTDLQWFFDNGPRVFGGHPVGGVAVPEFGFEYPYDDAAWRIGVMNIELVRHSSGRDVRGRGHHYLPESCKSYLTGGTVDSPYGDRRYATLAAAEAALSRCLVGWLRGRRKGLEK